MYMYREREIVIMNITNIIIMIVVISCFAALSWTAFFCLQAQIHGRQWDHVLFCKTSCLFHRLFISSRDKSQRWFANSLDVVLDQGEDR